MGKIKNLGLCIASSVLTVVLMLGFSHANIKAESQLIVKGPTNIVKGDIAEFQAQVTKPSWFLSKTIYQWKVLHSTGVIQHRAISDSDILVPSGTNDDKLWILTGAVNYHNYILWSQVTPLDVVVTPVTVGSPVPPGPNPPPPPPGPTPSPVTSPLWAIAIFDNTNPLTLTSDQLAIHNGTEDMQAALKPLSVTWRNYDKANPALSDPSWQALINQVGIPLVVLVDEKGKNYYKGKIVNKNDILSHINDIRGSK